jgi:methyl-accepting chemotaxis protein
LKVRVCSTHWSRRWKACNEKAPIALLGASNKHNELQRKIIMDSSKKTFRLSAFFGGSKSAQDRLSSMVRYALGIFGVLAVAYVATTVFITQRVASQGQLGAFAVSMLTADNELLEMRRNEKDFLARKTKAELDKHKVNFDQAMAALAAARSNPEVGAGDQATLDKLGKAVEAYRKSFVAAAELQVALGLDEDTGLHGELRDQVHSVEEAVKQLGSSDLEVAMLTLRRHEKDFILRGGDEYVANFGKVMAEFTKQVANSKMDGATRQKILADLAAYDKAFRQYVAGTTALDKAITTARASAREAEEPVPALVEAATTRSAAAAVLSRITLIGSAAALVVALAGVALLLWNTKKSADATLAERLAAQQKAEAENEMLNNSVISILEAVNQLSQRDLTARAPVTQDIIGTVSDSINALTDETSKVLRDVARIAGNVAMASGKVKGQAELVSQTAEDERKSVGEVIASLADATETMNQVAALAEQSNRSAERATQATDMALETVNGTVKGMESIRETISETEKRIKRLGERSQEITGIVNLINTISERTHVLALNASMQAAVAGEAGRGFAVVAEEVQRLAESSRNATQQIGTLVGNIQLETNETIATVNRTIGQVVVGSEQAQKAGEQMRLTQQLTGELVAQVRRIASSSEAQKTTSAELLKSVQGIGDSTERTAQQIHTQNQETETLLDSARRLVESVNVFKLPQAA